MDNMNTLFNSFISSVWLCCPS